jgi:hypothetical protein
MIQLTASKRLMDAITKLAEATHLGDFEATDAAARERAHQLAEEIDAINEAALTDIRDKLDDYDWFKKIAAHRPPNELYYETLRELVLEDCLRTQRARTILIGARRLLADRFR